MDFTAGSSQSLVKALKAPSDPPQPNGPWKIEIAREKWDSSTANFANKDEIIGEWLLTSLYKERASFSFYEHTVSDERYLSLLLDILSSYVSQPSKNFNSPPWLNSLLTRTSFVAIVSQYFSVVAQHGKLPGGRPSRLFAGVFGYLWPSSVHKAGHDALLDVFVNVLLLYATFRRETAESSAPISIISDALIEVVKSFRDSFSVVSNKKKTISTFSSGGLVIWLKCMSYLAPVSLSNNFEANKTEKDFGALLYLAGTEILCCLESLKGSQESQDFTGHICQAMQVVVQEDHRGLLLVPAIFKSYILALHSYRSSLFASSSSQSHTLQSRFADATLRTFEAFYSVTRQNGESEATWRAVASLLNVLRNFNLVNSGVVERFPVFSSISNWATESMIAREETDTGSPVLVLMELVHLEYVIIECLVPKIICNLAKMKTSHSTELFLLAILDQHVKSRTIDVYIGQIFDCISQLSPQMPNGTSQTVERFYVDTASCALLDPSHLDSLARAIHGFVTPGQVQTLTDFAFNALREAQKGFELAGEFEAGGEKKNRQKSKIEAATLVPTRQELSCIAFCLSAQLGVVVFSSLPLTSLLSSSLSDLQELIFHQWRQLFDSTFSKEMLHPRNQPDLFWRMQVSGAAILRLYRSLTPIIHHPNQPLSVQSHELCEDVVRVLGQFECIPELAVESCRFLLHEVHLQGQEGRITVLFSGLLQFISAHLNVNANATWSGKSSELGFLTPASREKAALALWHLCLSRWLTLFNEYASEQQINQLADLIITIQGQSGSLVGFTSKRVVENAITSALFWEMSKFRSSLGGLLNENTSSLEGVDMSKLFGNMKLKKHHPNSEQLEKILLSYQFLLHCPTEFLTYALRKKYIRRALVADVLFYCSGIQRLSLTGRIAVRSWLSRIMNSLNAEDASEFDHKILYYLNSPTYLITSPTSELIVTTIGLATEIYKHLVKLSIRGSETPLLAIIEAIKKDSPDLSGTQASQLYCGNLASLISEVVNIPPTLTVCERLVPLYKVLAERATHEIDLLLKTPRSLISRPDILSLWRHLLKLKAWIKEPENVSAGQYGSRILSIYAAQRLLDDMGTQYPLFWEELFFILLEEIPIQASLSRAKQVEIIVAAYVLIRRSRCLSDTSALDDSLARSLKSWTIEEFGHLTQLLGEALRAGKSPEQDLQIMISLSIIAIRESPEGASKIGQRYAEDCLRNFHDQPIYVESSPLCLEALQLLDYQVTGKPGMLRSLDVGSILSFLNKVMAKSTHHTDHTEYPIGHCVVNIASSLIRHRHDLVRSTLPHLSALLRQLLLSLRTIRPQLGAKQYRIVSDSFPRWMTPQEPFQVEEARLLSRLLTSLQTKTVLRKPTTKAVEQKADSLTRPFSKHAPFVLLAFIQAMNDPLCTVSSAIRKEMQAGIFALCGMISEHGRDSLMVSALDTNGQATLKTIWKEYERQRYVGSG